jgi:outer membrane protein assembly factor BamB
MMTIALAAPSSARAADWPQFRGPNRDGKSVETGLLAQWPEGGPKLLWSKTGLGSGYSHVAVAGGTIYVTGAVGEDGVLHAYAETGALPAGETKTPKWEAKYGPEWVKQHPGARSIPTVRDGFIYVVSGYGVVTCFRTNVEAGEDRQVWSAPLFEKYEAPQPMWGYAEGPLIDGDKVFCSPCGKKATFVALDRKTGAELWTSLVPDAPASGYCQPTIVEHKGKRMIVTMTKEGVVALTPEDGKVLWQFAYKNGYGNHCDTPLYSAGMLYITSGYGKGAVGLALNDAGTSVTQVWAQPKQDPVHGGAILLDGYVYASSHQTIGGRWSCVEFKTGKMMWEDPCVGKGGSVIFADGMLYCYSEDGNVGLVKPSPEKCQVVSTVKVPQGEGDHWAHLVVANGRMYVRHGDALMCYDVAKRQ